MASIIQVGQRWRAQVRRRGHATQTQTFESRVVAQKWARKLEREIDTGEFHDSGEALTTSLDDLIKRYKKERKKPLGRSHGYALHQLSLGLGTLMIPSLTSERIIRFARARTCKPVTWSAELSYLGTILRVARAVWKLPIVGDPVGDARLALDMLGYRMKGRERDRRPTASELIRLTEHFDAKSRQRIPMGKIMSFAIATTMRAEEVTRLVWSDLDKAKKTIVIRDRKDPLKKEGNDQTVPLLPAAWAIVESMPETEERIFPFKSKSFSSIFPRACQALTPPILNLHFHDLRHEGISRLFESGYAIQEVAVFSGHKDWRQLKRYTQIDPASLHRTRKRATKR